LPVSLVVRDLIVDCSDSPGLARFWGAVLERPVEGAGEGFWVSLPDGNQPSGIFFREVADGKQVKNRLHLDLNPGDGTLAAELERLTALGATVLARHNRGSDLGWVVLADPEGNEFCVQSSDAEVAAFEERLEAEDAARRPDPPATSQSLADHTPTTLGAAGSQVRGSMPARGDEANSGLARMSAGSMRMRSSLDRLASRSAARR